MMPSVRISMLFRPMRSPKWPKITPPIGRAMKPIANVVYASNVPTVGSNVGKKSLLKTRLANVPYKKKSYHSIVVPIALASATVRTLFSAAWSIAFVIADTPQLLST